MAMVVLAVMAMPLGDAMKLFVAVPTGAIVFAIIYGHTDTMLFVKNWDAMILVFGFYTYGSPELAADLLVISLWESWDTWGTTAFCFKDCSASKRHVRVRNWI